MVKETILKLHEQDCSGGTIAHLLSIDSSTENKCLKRLKQI